MDERSEGTVRIVREGADPTSLALDVLELAVLEGPDRGLRRRLALGLVRVGSGAGNDLVLTDPTVSTAHAEVSVEADGLRVRDLGSTNGTFVGGVQVTELTSPGALECRLGQTRLAVREVVEQRPARLREGDDRLGGLVGRSRAMREVFSLLRAAAPTRVSVLLTGESGTGKELAARALHDLSGRPGALAVFDAGTADPQLIRSDLFGHVQGAFTGAQRDRPGALREAEGGTLFLDELGELPLDLQSHLLRALETRTVVPVGSTTPVPVDVRLVAATHRDLAAMVAAGDFREDLYHRVAVLPVHLPPLRDRAEDVRLIAAALCEALVVTKPLSEAALQALEAHPWPGNVRALRNALERASVISTGAEIEPADLRLAPAAAAAAATPSGELERSEREVTFRVLERHGGNKTAAARELGIAVATLRRRLKRYRDEG